jgi:hypothetical protein
MLKIRISNWPFYSPADLARRKGSIAIAKLKANDVLISPKGWQPLNALRLEKSKIPGGNKP